MLEAIGCGWFSKDETPAEATAPASVSTPGSPPAPTTQWRSRSFLLRGGSPVEIRFPADDSAAADEGAVIDAILVGLTAVLDTLSIDDPVPLTVYVHPDVRSQLRLTGKGGEGHADVTRKEIHVLHAEPPVVEAMASHEGTHVLAHHALGPPGTTLMDEGLAVWVADAYGGRSLSAWALDLAQTVDRRTLVGPGFEEAPESEAYPFAGLFVRAAVRTVGLAAVREHLVPATPETWDAALAAAGTSHAALVAAVAP